MCAFGLSPICICYSYKPLDKRLKVPRLKSIISSLLHSPDNTTGDDTESSGQKVEPWDAAGYRFPSQTTAKFG